MIYFNEQYFQKIDFTREQVDSYFESAEHDIKIAEGSDISDIIFKFCYDALLKTGIAVIAKEGYKVRSEKGHHIHMLEKLREILRDEDVAVIGNKMRQERNLNLYGGSRIISKKDSLEYLDFVRKIFKKARAHK